MIIEVERAFILWLGTKIAKKEKKKVNKILFMQLCTYTMYFVVLKFKALVMYL